MLLGRLELLERFFSLTENWLFLPLKKKKTILGVLIELEISRRTPRDRKNYALIFGSKIAFFADKTPSFFCLDLSHVVTRFVLFFEKGFPTKKSYF